MKRQPFLPHYKDTPTLMSADLIERLPRLAQLVRCIAINWSGVDLQLALTLGSLIGVQNAAAVAVFLSLRNHRAQRHALEAAADKTLTGDLKKLFAALLLIHRELDKQRNNVIHCVWGQASATPDGIIWSSLQDHANMLITDYHLEKTSQLKAEERPTQITKDYFVVRYDDLEQLNASVMRFAHAIRNFHVCLRYPDEAAGKNARDQLMGEPLVQNALAKISA
jgi:hypothetical protein